MSFQWLYPPSISLAPRRATSLPFGLPGVRIEMESHLTRAYRSLKEIAALA